MAPYGMRTWTGATQHICRSNPTPTARGLAVCISWRARLEGNCLATTINYEDPSCHRPGPFESPLQPHPYYTSLPDRMVTRCSNPFVPLVLAVAGGSSRLSHVVVAALVAAEAPFLVFADIADDQKVAGRSLDLQEAYFGAPVCVSRDELPGANKADVDVLCRGLGHPGWVSIGL